MHQNQNHIVTHLSLGTIESLRHPGKTPSGVCAPFICSYGRSPDRLAGLVSKFHDTTVVSHVVSCCSWVRGWWGAAQLGCTPHLARRHATPETTTQFTRCRPGGTRQVLVAQRKRRISMAVLLTSPEVRLLNSLFVISVFLVLSVFHVCQNK